MGQYILTDAELIVRPDGSIYHLGIRPEELAKTIITVGDPDRVPMVSQYLDEIELEKRSREFAIHTGRLGGTRMSIISTGIGTGNIEIVMHELDYLVNMDLNRRIPLQQHTGLRIIRLGTSGALQPDIPCGSLLLSQNAFAADGLNRYYPIDIPVNHPISNSEFWTDHCYWTQADSAFASALDLSCLQGVTYTAQGFYAPQYRNTRKQLNRDKQKQLQSLGVSNIEMETAGIYLMAEHLGHSALSYNAILANRATGEFHKHPGKAVEQMIKTVLEALSH